MDPIEIVAAGLGVANIVLLARRSMWNYPFGIAMVALYAEVFFRAKDEDLDQAAAFSNAFGPEHLEIQTSDPDAVLALIDNAGAIFLGPFAPVSLGDYAAGSNHVLPTGGQARFSAALGAYTFLRPQQVVRYSRDGLAGVADHILALSQAEALPAHGDAVSARFPKPAER